MCVCVCVYVCVCVCVCVYGCVNMGVCMCMCHDVFLEQMLWLNPCILKTDSCFYFGKTTDLKYRVRKVCITL